EYFQQQEGNNPLRLDSGHAGTVLRFLALRVARKSGNYILEGTPRLFERPQAELSKLLRQLGCLVETTHQELHLESAGWRLMGDQVHIDTSKSSQFASAFLLNAWGYPQDIFFRTTANWVSQSYFDLTLAMVRQAGMKVEKISRQEFLIPANQVIHFEKKIECECDMSSAFALAACAVVGGRVLLTSWPEKSLQPDFRFVEILQQMGAQVQFRKGALEVHQTTTKLSPVKINLKNCPDLFPSLSALAAIAEGESSFSGLDHLVHKESDRLAQMCVLFERLEIPFQRGRSEIRIKGQGEKVSLKKDPILFEPDGDHRLAMAAMVLKLAGYPLKIQDADVVNKSFPNFWKIVGAPI
ncbi:MAG: 3-phosphoshikimate 1-carboxyvinyltransferase, partial [Bdellovibrionales bacterium]|nr:3-phosphoshikimate 1-carboxyvinyltransferase [Bdellovibrionales bacterium]